MLGSGGGNSRSASPVAGASSVINLVTAGDFVILSKIGITTALFPA